MRLKMIPIATNLHLFGVFPANGLGATDIATRGATTGLFREFVNYVLDYYIEKYGKDSNMCRTF